MKPFQFQKVLIFWDLPNGIFETKIMFNRTRISAYLPICTL
jgi:hypothetical protein